MKKKIVFVTGSTSGIGKQTALELAKQGHQVHIHGRNPDKITRALDQIRSTSGNREVYGHRANFSNLSEVESLSEELYEELPRLDVLINNAGINASAKAQTIDGHELTWQVNHLAPSLLTGLLLDLLGQSATGRVVTVSSHAHKNANINWKDPEYQEREYVGYESYCQSKLANILFSNALVRLVSPEKIGFFTLHPGVIDTALLRVGFPGVKGSPVEEGATTSVYVATEDILEGQSGIYYADSLPAETSALAQSFEAQDRLLRLTRDQLPLLDELLRE